MEKGCFGLGVSISDRARIGGRTKERAMLTLLNFPSNFSSSTSRISIQLVYTQNDCDCILVFLGLFFILFSFYFITKFYLYLMEGHNKRKRIDWKGASTSREPGPAQSGSPEDDDNSEDEDPHERVRLQKAIKKRICGLLKKYCDRYCKKMGFCGKYCSRGRAGFDFLGAAHEIAKDEFFYDEASARVKVLHRLLNFLTKYYSDDAWTNDDMNAHWLHDVMRRTPPSS